ncbi:MAG TPA: ribose 5-phosphate isomerase B [Haliangiales bacterium]|nr:ribose 5-phosphate isomerase B [Haliangiales bacterium]
MKWYAGSDHAGYELKAALVGFLRGLGDEVEDLGTTNAADSVDYPEFGARVGRAVVAAPGAMGLAVCGTGIGISIAANKVAGIRAARVTDEFSARMAREHNDANVVCLGGRVTGPGLAEGIVRAFRDATFAGGRHQRRVDKIEGLE